jgi:hypothetical protein
MHDAYSLGETPFGRVSLLLGFHRTSMADPPIGEGPVPIVVEGWTGLASQTRRF